MARNTIRIDLIERDIAYLVGEGAKEDQVAAFRQFAREERDKAREQNRQALGIAPDYETLINGSPGRIEQADLSSVIDIEFELATEMYRWIHEILVIHSPVGKPSDPRPGHPTLYAESHVLFVDGNLMDPYGPIPPHEEAVFVNIQPYARKIERGTLSSQAPDGVYQVVAALAKRRFGNYASIKFSYRTPYAFGAIHQWADTTSMQSPYRRGEKRDEWLRRQPAIVITL